MKDVTVTATAVVDQLVADDGAVVLVDAGGQHRVLRLSAMGQAVREFALSGVPLSRLTDELVERFGAAGDNPADAVATLVRELESAGLVRVDG